MELEKLKRMTFREFVDYFKKNGRFSGMPTEVFLNRIREGMGYLPNSILNVRLGDVLMETLINNTAIFHLLSYKGFGKKTYQELCRIVDEFGIPWAKDLEEFEKGTHKSRTGFNSDNARQVVIQRNFFSEILSEARMSKFLQDRMKLLSDEGWRICGLRVTFRVDGQVLESVIEGVKK